MVNFPAVTNRDLMPAAATTANAPNLLVVDDDETIQRLLVIAAQDQGWHPVVAGSGEEAMDLLGPDIRAVVLDHGLPGMNGIETLAAIRHLHPALPVIMLTGLNDAETAVQAMRTGAADYLTKPFELKRLFSLLGQARQARSSEPAPVITVSGKHPAGPKLRSANPQLRKLLDHLAKAARLDSTILLTGESGTGKTHFAREIHRLSPRKAEDFITVSCPALPRELLESELFGHERGAFTGATAARAGRFEQASKGTLFLDEIGDLPTELQPKLLTVLQDREFFRVGGSKQLETNARVIAATNINLRERVEQGTFREDLYYRLNIIELHIPALRERPEDIPALVGGILADIARRRGTEGWHLAPEAMDALCGFDWPGNIRQLQNVLERATAFSEKADLQESDIQHLLKNRGDDPVGAVPADIRGLTLQEVERNAFIQTYLRTGKNKARTARELGISERSVYNLLARHGLK
jgi:DNA-binding NtrC family response regulator